MYELDGRTRSVRGDAVGLNVGELPGHDLGVDAESLQEVRRASAESAVAVEEKHRR